MRYSIGILGAAAAVVVAIVLLTIWYTSKEDEINTANADAQQLKADRDKVKADRDKVNADLDKMRVEGERHKVEHKAEVARLKASLGQIPEGEDFPRPALESVPELGGEANFFGFQSIHVYRWRGGTLEGSFHFVTEAGPVKQDLQVTKLAKNMFAGQKPPYDPRAVSGVVVIAIKRGKYAGKKDRSDWMYECVVNIQVNIKIYPVPKNGVTGHGRGYTLSGVIDGSRPGLSLPSMVGTSGGDDTHVTGVLQGYKDWKTHEHGVTYPVYQLKVSTDQ